jgi:glycosyltransferase involved in cell wall biosynthesis
MRHVSTAMKIRIVTNMARLAGTRHEGAALEFSHHESRGVASAVGTFFRSFRHDFILLDGTVRDALILAALKVLVPFHRAKLVLLDILLSTPSGFRGMAKAWLIGRLLRRTHRIMLYYRNTKGLQQHYGIPADRFLYIPFKVNQREMISRITPLDGGYVFCGGKTRRDFATLFDAVKDLDYPVKVVTTSNSDIAQHGSYIDERTAPPNVQVVRLDGSPEAFISHMASARLVVLPITPEICGAGISVYAQAMALRKCVIISSGPGAEDVLTSDQAIVVPPRDATALKAAIQRAFEDPSYREPFERNGYNWAMSLGGEKELYETILSDLQADVSVRELPGARDQPREESLASDPPADHELLAELTDLDLGKVVPTTIRRLGWNRGKPVYLVEDQEGQLFVVKKSLSSGLRSMTGRAAHERELAAYRTLPTLIGDRVRIPRLIAYGPGHLVLEYMAPVGPAYQAIRTHGVASFAEAVAAFHWDTPPVPLPIHLDWLHRSTYSPEADAIRAALGPLRRFLGLRVARRCLRVIGQCRSEQPRLFRHFNAHNDLWASNVLPAADGRYQLIDFAALTPQHRWVLDDIVRFGFLTRDMGLTRALVEAYIEDLNKRNISGVIVRPQIRFALLHLSMNMLTWDKLFNRVASSFIVGTLLRDGAFGKWLVTWPSPFPAGGVAGDLMDDIEDENL